MTKSELIEALVNKQPHLSLADVEKGVNILLEHMSQALSLGERIEVRGFGSFSLHYREPRTGRNPKTGELVKLGSKYVPHFRAGKALRDRVDEGAKEYPISVTAHAPHSHDEQAEESGSSDQDTLGFQGGSPFHRG